MTLAALVLGTGVTVDALLSRVPFSDVDLERSLNLPRGACAAARGLRLEAEPAARLAAYLARYVVEGAVVDTDVACWQDTPTGPHDDGLRLFVRCSVCHRPYILGGVNTVLVIETGHHDEAGIPVNLIYYAGDTVRCPAASHNFCTATASAWAPRAARVHPSVAAVEALS